MKSKKTVPLRLEGRVYAVTPSFVLVREIESELGSIAALAGQLASDAWRVSDLVVLVQMMLQSAGHTADYVALGEAMMKEGLAHYRAAAEVLLNMVLHAE